MADSEKSFDIVSKIDMQNVKNAVNQSMKEINQRFDFKGTKSDIRLEKESLLVVSDDNFKLKSVVDILKGKLAKANVSLKTLQMGKVENALGGLVKQEIKLENGISSENAKQVVKDIKLLKLKVQAQIQGDQLRVSGKKIDDLQTVIKFLKEKNYDFNIEFTNYR